MKITIEIPTKDILELISFMLNAPIVNDEPENDFKPGDDIRILPSEDCVTNMDTEIIYNESISGLYCQVISVENKFLVVEAMSRKFKIYKHWAKKI